MIKLEKASKKRAERVSKLVNKLAVEHKRIENIAEKILSEKEPKTLKSQLNSCDKHLGFPFWYNK
jgi:hypothetical protein